MLKAAIIGTGFIGNTHAGGFNHTDDVELVAIADVNEETCKKTAAEYGVKYYKDAEEMIRDEDINIIDVCLPTFLHEKYVLMAAKYGKHVMCEKPFALSMEAAQNMIDATRKAGVKFMIAQVMRFWPEYVRIKEYYDQGKIGDIKMVYSSRLAQHPNWTTWHKDPKKSGGALYDMHLHDVDYMCYLFGDVASVYATGAKSDTGCWNHVMSHMRFKGGQHATIEGAMDMSQGFPFTMSFRAVGSQGTIDYRFVSGFNLENVGDAIRNTVYFKNGALPQELEIDPYDGYQKEIAYFVACIKDDTPIEVVSPEHSLYVLRVINAIEESLETGNVVYL